MNILFLTLLDFNSLEESNIYTDLLKEFKKSGHNVNVVSPIEKRKKKRTYIITEENTTILKLKIGNIQKTNSIEKGISTIRIESQVIRALKKYFKDIKFDLVLYATPPITFGKVVRYIKKRDNAKSYLMLKDIFPQNAVDLKMFSKKGIFYKYFRKKEIELYKISDTIGCMSPKNVEYILRNNDFIDKNKVEVFPNCINVDEKNKRKNEINIKYRNKYNIPLNSKVFMYGGNLGKPQGISFVIKCLEKVKNLDNSFFIICGKGTEYKKIEYFKNSSKMKNLLLLNGLPKNEYTEFLNVADVGLIFLDYNFTIPNFPSRVLSYMEKGIPILSCTDPITDIGDLIEENNFGWKCYSNDKDKFYELTKTIISMNTNKLIEMGKNGNLYLNNKFDTKREIKHFTNMYK